MVKRCHRYSPLREALPIIGFFAAGALMVTMAIPQNAGAAAYIHDGAVVVPVSLDEYGNQFFDSQFGAANSDGSVVAFFRRGYGERFFSFFVRDVHASTTENIAVGTEINNINPLAALSADGTAVVYGTQTPDGIFHLYLYDRRTHTSLVIHESTSGLFPALSGDGNSIVYERIDGGAHSLVLLDRSSGTTETIDDAGEYYEHVEASSDGRFIAFSMRDAVSSRKNILYDRTTREKEVLPDDHAFYPSVSDDGRYIVYPAVANDTTMHAFIYDRSTGVIEDVARGLDRSGDVATSADGRFLIFLQSGVNGARIDVYDRETHTTQTAIDAPFGNFPKISSNGQWIGFDSCDQLFVPFTTCVHSYSFLISNPFLVSTSSPPVATSTPACTHDCYSNVLFLPGIESSRLYRPQVVGDPETRLWEPGGDDDVRDLYMRENGEGWRDDVYTKDGDVLDELPIVGQNIYKSFIAKMNELKDDGLINDWLPAAYDWRLSLDEILTYGNNVDGKIYYTGDLRATSTPYIIQELRRLAASSKSGKVTIVAHSNGGLVAKQLTNVLGEEADDLIDKMIFVAVPQAGTPDAIKVGLHGEAIGDGGWVLGASKPVVRSFASTSPMFYHLLPSKDYFTFVDDPVITFDPSLTDWINRYGQTIDSREGMDAFLSDSYGRVDAETGDTDQPTQFKSDLLAEGQAVHDNLDNWIPPAGVHLVQIAGWGLPKTVSGITYKKNGNGVKAEPNTTIDGDGTVVVPSALWTGASLGSENYWVNLNDLNNKRIITSELKEKLVPEIVLSALC